MFTLLANSGLWNIFSIYPRESVRDKVIIVNLEINFMHINKTNCVILLHSNLNKILIWDWVIFFHHNSFLISDFYAVENIPKNAWTQDVVWKAVFILWDDDFTTIAFTFWRSLTNLLTVFEIFFIILLKSKKNMCLWMKIWFWNMLKQIMFAQMLSIQILQA